MQPGFSKKIRYFSAIILMPMYRKCLLLLCCLLMVRLVSAQLPAPDGYHLMADQVYTTAGQWQGKMDLYLTQKAEKPTPLVIFIHGGGWVHGRKEDEKDFSVFFGLQYAVANVEYRLADVAPAPAAIQDCRCALFYLIGNAKKLNLDVQHVVVMGGSAGGHLALMTALLGNDHRFDQNCAYTDKFHISAIVDKYGPTDLNRWEAIRKASKASSAWMGGRADDTVWVNTLSPISYITKNAPPTLIIHGDKDHTVPPQQS